MAVRIHVTAARNCTPEQVQICFTDILGPNFAAVHITEHDGWVWFTTSVWGVGGDALCKGLARLGTPGLQFTTSDGSRWHLAVFGSGQEPVWFLHEFHTFGYPPDPARDHEYTEPEPAEPYQVDPELQFLENDPEPEKPERPWSPFAQIAADYESMSIPETFRDEVQPLPYSQALLRFRQWYAGQFLAALTAAGIPHDAGAVRRALLWENLTGNERDNDLGNLPRLLAALKLGGDWDNYVHQAENPPPAEETCPAPEPTPTEYRAAVKACLADKPLTPPSGGAVELPLKKLAAIAFPVEACTINESPYLLLRLEVPGAFAPADFPLPEDSYTRGELEFLPKGVEIGLENQQLLAWSHLKNLFGKAVAKLLRRPPNGSILECSFGRADEPAACQRYRGTVRDEVWHIDATHPPLTQEALREALSLAGMAERTRKYEARDEAEANAVMHAVERDSYLHNMDVRRKGLTIACKYDVGQLAALFFRHRCRAWWDITAVEAGIEKEYRERLQMEKQMRRQGATAARQRAAPHDEAVLYEGKKSRFWRSDFTLLTDLDAAQREEFDRIMTGLGYRHLGDLVAKKHRDIILRCFGSADGLVYAILMGKKAFYLGHECISYFADGSRLTSTTNSSVDSHPEIKVYYKDCSGLTPAQVEAKHRWGIARFLSHKQTQPVPLDMSLLGVARALDEAIALEEERQERLKRKGRDPDQE